MAGDVGTDLKRLVDQTERLGVIGSPSSTAQLALDILGSAVNRKLVGELALFPFSQDSSAHYALGQITEIQLRNIWHEDPTMRSLIRQRGRVDAVSERQDPHSAFDARSRQYTFMTIGPVSPLSFSGSPLFLNAFNTVDAFLDANGLRGV